MNLIRRLPRYFRTFCDLAEKNVPRISSRQLGRIMDLTASQIRQDFSQFGELFGLPGYGYSVQSVRNQLRTILGMDQNYSAVLIGAGKLGQVLIGNFTAVADGYHLCGAFDSDPAVIGRSISGCPVYDVQELGTFVESNHTDIAILTVPSHAAQEVTDCLVNAGIRGIWNFTNIEISTGESDTAVENIHFSDSFLALSFVLARTDKTPGRGTEPAGPADPRPADGL